MDCTSTSSSSSVRIEDHFGLSGYFGGVREDAIFGFVVGQSGWFKKQKNFTGDVTVTQTL
jgi:hypothetical protein